MEKTKSKRSMPTKLIAFVLSFAMVVSVLTGALPGASLTTSAEEPSLVGTIVKVGGSITLENAWLEYYHGASEQISGKFELIDVVYDEGEYGWVYEFEYDGDPAYIFVVGEDGVIPNGFMVASGDGKTEETAYKLAPYYGWEVGDTLNMNKTYVILDDTFPKGVFQCSAADITIPSPEYDSRSIQWYFRNCIRNDNSSADLWLSVPDGKTESDVPTGFELASGDGSSSSPYLFKLMYGEEAPSVPEASDFTFGAPSATNLVYDGSAKSAIVVTDLAGVGDITVHYYTDAARTQEVAEANVKNATTYYVGITTTGGDIYDPVTDPLYGDDWKFTITPAAPQATDFKFTAPESLDYDGEAKTATVVANEGISGMGDITVGYYSDEECKNVIDTADLKNAGDYYVGITVTAGDNYSAVTTPIHGATWKYTIKAITAMIFWSDTVLKYDGTEKKPTAEVMNKAVGDDVEVTVEGGAHNAGVYTATATKLTGDDADNYIMPETGLTQLYTIEKGTASLEVEIADWTYGGEPSKPVISGVPGGGDALVEYKKVNAKNKEYTEEVPKDAGVYNIRVSLPDDDNYEAVSVVDTFTINPIVAKLEWGDDDFDYTGYDQCPEATVSNLIAGDKCKVTVMGAATEAGLHIATATKLSNSNYVLPEGEDAEWIFYIEKAVPELEISMSGWTYGEKANSPKIVNNPSGGMVTYSYASFDSLVAYAAALIVPEEVDYTLDEIPTDAGYYIVKAESAETSNYATGADYEGFVVKKLVAELDWSGYSVVYTGNAQIPTCEVTNLVDGDECDVTVEGSQTEVGSYTVQATELSNDNYKLPGTVTQDFVIAKDTPEFIVSLTGWTYGGEENEPAIEGYTGETEPDFTYYNDEECTMPTTNEDGAWIEGGVPGYAGTYYVKAEVDETDHFNHQEDVAEFTIEKRQLGVEWSENEFVYNGKEQAPVAVATNVAEGDTVELQVDGAQKNAGSYEANISFMPGAENRHNYYMPEERTCAFTIAPRVAEFDWVTGVFEYNGTEQCPEAIMTNLVKGDKCKIIVSGAAMSIGTHTAVVVRLTNKNYEIPEDAEQEFEIVKAAQFINAKNMTLKFGQTKAIGAEASGDGALTYTLKSGKNVIKLDANGTVTALKEGKAVVEIKAAETPFCIEAETTIEVTVTSDVISIYRVYNPNSGEHVYTKSAAEKDSLVKAGWKDEGVAWKSPVKSNTPVYRLYNANAGDHHYTVNEDEKANLIKAGWKDEGIVWYSDDLKTAAVYRVYNPNATTGSHHFTKNDKEVKELVKAGWQDEAVAFYSK